jgi:L-glutamine---4-(methylsulfanyl)-2-oxobutanoate aminotransferase
VIERLAETALEDRSHGYPPFRGLPELRRAIAERYRELYGVELDPDREVSIVPGTKTAIVELALVLAERGSTILLPDPGYPDYPSGVAMSAAKMAPLPLLADAGWAPDFEAVEPDGIAAVYLNYPSNPCAAAVRPGVFADAVRFAEATGAAIVHDFAYGDIVFDRRRPESFLATPGAREVGVEMFSMSKSYGMAGWRLGFVVGNAEVVERLDLLQDHARVGIFVPVQEAGIAALSGPQDSVAARVATYERRRDRVREALAGTRVAPPECEGSFYVWFDLPDGVTPDSLLVEHRVAVAPGEGFGSRGRGWARISLAITDEQLELGLGRLQRAFA